MIDLQATVNQDTMMSCSLNKLDVKNHSAIETWFLMSNYYYMQLFSNLLCSAYHSV